MPRLCNRCVIPDTATNVELGSDGICNLCRTYEKVASRLTDFGRLAGLRDERFARVRGKFEYDALVGLSGGKDSSYVAYRLVREHGLKILLMTYDNGFLSDIARRNIATVVRELGQDHLFVSPSHDLHREIYRASLRKFGVPCLGCTFPGFAAAIRIALEKRIPLLVHGRSRAQMFKDLAPGAVDPHLPFLEGNLAAPDVDRNRRFLLTMSRKLNGALRGLALHPRFADEVKRLFTIEPQAVLTAAEPPEFVGYFLYEKYEEDLIKSVLEKAIGWSRPEGPHLVGQEDCVVHPAAAYLYTLDHGYPLMQQELAAAVREGILSREQALARLEANEHARHLSPEAMQGLVSMSGFEARRILRYAKRVRKALGVLRITLKARNACLGWWLARRIPLLESP